MNNFCNPCRMILTLHMLVLFCIDLVPILDYNINNKNIILNVPYYGPHCTIFFFFNFSFSNFFLFSICRYFSQFVDFRRPPSVEADHCLRSVRPTSVERNPLRVSVTPHKHLTINSAFKVLESFTYF